MNFDAYANEISYLNCTAKKFSDFKAVDSENFLPEFPTRNIDQQDLDFVHSSFNLTRKRLKCPE